MSEAETDETDDESITGCAAADCEYDARWVEAVTGGYRLTCGEHAGEAAVDLAEFDFRDVDDEDTPAVLRRLGMVSNIRYSWVNEWDTSLLPSEQDRKTASLVVRDADGEIVGESERCNSGGVFSLVRVRAPDDIDDYKLGDPPELPEWAEWEHCGPPMHHHVDAVACSECGEANELVLYSKMPEAAARSKPWEHIRHRADCSLSTDLEKELWFDKQYAIEIRSRTDPRRMALDCVWAELEEFDNRGYSRGDAAEEAIRRRKNDIYGAMLRRMAPGFPGCAECGGELERRHEYELVCLECGKTAEHDTIEEWFDESRRVIGARGQGDRGWSPDA